MVKAAAELGISTLGDHSVIMCMFSDSQLTEIFKNGGELNSRCEGTLDIKPDLQVIYCLPMNSFFPEVYLNQFENLDQIDLYFENRIKRFRILDLPLHECPDCEYRKRGECHGGCLAHRDFSKSSLRENLHQWTTRFLLERKLALSKDFAFEMQTSHVLPTYLVSEISSGNCWAIDSATYDVLHLFDGASTLRDLSANIERITGSNIEESRESLDELFEKARTYGFLELV
jgi:radical SAM protein with 4Fe4S-binding SPASM domain